jgi:hypothetical protein
MHHNRLAALIAVGILMLLVVAGCSHKSPTSPSLNPSSLTQTTSPMDPSHPWAALVGEVKTIDTVARTMSLVGNPMPIVIDTGVKVTKMENDSLIMLTLADVLVGDTVIVRGQMLMTAHSFLAQWINLVSRPNDSGNGGHLPFPGPVTKLSGRVLTNDTITRVMTITNFDHNINVASFARIFKWGTEGGRPARLAHIVVGDSVDVRGKLEADSTLTAYDIAVRSNHEWHFHPNVVFAGPIATIDQGALTFTVTGHPELIRTDSLTFFFLKQSSGRDRGNTALSGGDGNEGKIPDSGFTKLTFTDFNVGDTVGVFATRIDSLTLYAVAVQDSVHLHARRGGDVKPTLTVNPANKE